MVGQVAIRRFAQPGPDMCLLVCPDIEDAIPPFPRRMGDKNDGGLIKQYVSFRLPFLESDAYPVIKSLVLPVISVILRRGFAPPFF